MRGAAAHGNGSGPPLLVVRAVEQFQGPDLILVFTIPPLHLIVMGISFDDIVKTFTAKKVQDGGFNIISVTKHFLSENLLVV